MAEDKGEQWVTGRPRSNNPGGIGYFALTPEEIQQVVEEYNADISRLIVHIEKRDAAQCSIGEAEDKSTYYLLIKPKVNTDYPRQDEKENTEVREYEQQNLDWWKSRADVIEKVALDWARKYVGTDKPIKPLWQTSGWASIPEQLGLDTYDYHEGWKQIKIRFNPEYYQWIEIPVYKNFFYFSAGAFQYGEDLQAWSLDEEKVKRCNEACRALVDEAYERNKGNAKFNSRQIKEMTYQMSLIIQREYGLLDENQFRLK